MSGAQGLDVIDGGPSGQCGHPTLNGSPCERTTKGGGFCYQHTNRSPGLPDAPDHLDPLGVECWYYHVRQCKDMGVLNQIDLTLIEQTAEMYQMRRAAVEAAGEGATIEGRDGTRKTNPAWSKVKDFANNYLQCVKELRRQKDSADPVDDQTRSASKDDPWMAS